MTFVPVIPFGGLAGLAFLQRTRENQQDAFEATPRLQRVTDRFRTEIAGIRSADGLVADRELLEVALGAFGLGEDINNSFYVTKVLSSDTADPESFVNRLSDKRYLTLAEAFGFGRATGPRTALDGFADRIVDAYKTRSFEAAVGDVDPDMRLVMGFQRELQALVARTGSEDAQWYGVIASKPLREVFARAFGLPQSFGALDVDQQLSVFRKRSEQFFGVAAPAAFTDPDRAENLERQFLAQRQLAAGSQASTTSASVALSLLQAMQPA
ncbi:Protein of unknown function [Tranquillimonas rosea]|uniref:DUF1217 domain-containing protein n=1 Tax=Tranquillimonas rosea TaxID=641238 RepID=A0A1H9X4X7_9RHOB|nr:DUF1217 domain-containing protein [Tranquillimonas rosea]SES41205.1 Protein of unknown function [Tranquillimonas rosea]